MAAEVIQLEVGRDSYPLQRDFPVKHIFMVINGIHYDMMHVSPAQMIRARDQPVRGFPQLFAIMEPQTIDIYPSPTTGITLEVLYDEEERYRRERQEYERQIWIWRNGLAE